MTRLLPLYIQDHPTVSAVATSPTTANQFNDAHSLWKDGAANDDVDDIIFGEGSHIVKGCCLGEAWEARSFLLGVSSALLCA
jgi:hypothetical protein